MTSASPDSPPDDVPGADWAEQQAEADPVRAAEEAAAARSTPESTPLEANEADVIEQEREIFDDEE